jgi:hypothetical protein
VRSPHVELAAAQVSGCVKPDLQSPSEASAYLGRQTLQIDEQRAAQRLPARIEGSKVFVVQKNPVPVRYEQLAAMAGQAAILHGARQLARYLAGVQAGPKEPLKGALHQLFGQSFKSIQSVHR